MKSAFPEKIEYSDISLLPAGHFEGRIFLLETPQAARKAALHLQSTYTVLGFDTETKPSFKKGKKNNVSLLQLASANEAFLFRLNMCGFIPELAHLLADTSIKKIGVAVHDDIKHLCNLRPFTPAAFIDLQSYAKQFGILDCGLKKITAIVLGINISKSQRLTNWETRQLSPQQLIYAATDAWVCHRIYHRLNNDE